jgi:hypothetical protein
MELGPRSNPKYRPRAILKIPPAKVPVARRGRVQNLQTIQPQKRRWPAGQLGQARPVGGTSAGQSNPSAQPQKPVAARFTPQQADKSLFVQIPMEIRPALPPRSTKPPRRVHTIRATAKTGGGQVHPTASSKLSFRSDFHGTRPALQPKVPSPCHFENSTSESTPLRDGVEYRISKRSNLKKRRRPRASW